MDVEYGRALVSLREDHNLTQEQLAEKIKVSQSKVSRIEKGDASLEDVRLYLDALNSEKALSLLESIEYQWSCLDRVTLSHPDLNCLLGIDKTLAEIKKFKSSDNVSALMSNRLELLENRLQRAGKFLSSLDHEIVYVGEIGVGKTTAACVQGRLALDQNSLNDLKGLLLDTGGGRTTICEVKVSRGSEYKISIEPVQDEEIYQMVSELCRSVFDKSNSTSSLPTTEFKPPEEVERALRNLMGMPRPSRSKKGEPPKPDPLAELASNFEDLQKFTQDVSARLGLWNRRERQIVYKGTSAIEARKWLKENFSRINGGRHPAFSLPLKIKITTQESIFENSNYNISIIDTRGVDGSAIRPDLIDHMRDSRSLILLCSKWGSAPDPTLQSLIKHVNETDSDESLVQRTSVLIIARTGDALSMRFDNGDSAETVEDGYEIKKDQTIEALRKSDIDGVEAIVFDSSNDDPSYLSNFLFSKIDQLRKSQVESAYSTITTVQGIIENIEESQAEAAFDQLANSISVFVARRQEIKVRTSTFIKNIVNAIVSQHVRTVWASLRRNGEYWNFDIYQTLSDSAASISKVGCSDSITGIKEILHNHRADRDLIATHNYIDQMIMNLSVWENGFLKAVRMFATNIYKPILVREKELWQECEKPYGTGMPEYRKFVAEKIEYWLESNESKLSELESAIGVLWEREVVQNLRLAAQVGH